jgi:hypothetical protein
MRYAAVLTSLAHLIRHVISVCAEKQVRRIDARANIAAMTDAHRWWDWAIEQFPDGAMRVSLPFRLLRFVHDPVSQSIHGTGPHPAWDGIGKPRDPTSGGFEVVRRSPWLWRLSNLAHHGLVKFRLTVCGADGFGSTLCDHVVHVLACRAEKQMIRSDTAWGIAPMTHMQTLWNRAMCQFPGGAMGLNHSLPSAASADATIAVRHPTGPQPTAKRVVRCLDITRQTFSEWSNLRFSQSDALYREVRAVTMLVTSWRPVYCTAVQL